MARANRGMHTHVGHTCSDIVASFSNSSPVTMRQTEMAVKAYTLTKLVNTDPKKDSLKVVQPKGALRISLSVDQQW